MHTTTPQFGIFPSPLADRVEDIAAATRLADDLGLDLIGIQDHPYQRRFVDTFALIAWLAAQTQRITSGWTRSSAGSTSTSNARSAASPRTSCRASATR